jgi:hypothetical protein
VPSTVRARALIQLHKGGRCFHHRVIGRGRRGRRRGRRCRGCGRGCRYSGRQRCRIRQSGTRARILDKAGVQADDTNPDRPKGLTHQNPSTTDRCKGGRPGITRDRICSVAAAITTTFKRRRLHRAATTTGLDQASIPGRLGRGRQWACHAKPYQARL